MQVRNLELLILEREKVCSQIRALRVQDIRKTRLQLLVREDKTKIDKLIEDMDDQISKVFYDKDYLDDLLDRIEDLLEHIE